MNEDTRQLLKECTAGCKMAVESIQQVAEYVQEEKLLAQMEEYKKKHKQVKEEAENMLEQAGCEEKEPGMMASAFSWFSTEMHLALKRDSQQIAKIMMDGCNMGIQKLSEYYNAYEMAEPKARTLVKHLIEIEEAFMKEMKSFC